MSRSRQMLHLSKLDEFAAFCESQGFQRDPPKDYYEVLRMTKPGSEPLLVHKKLYAKEHVTTWGVSQRMFYRWRDAKRNAAMQSDTAYEISEK